MKKYFFPLLCLLLLCHHAFPSQVTDSLEHVLAKAPDSTQADIYSELCFRYLYTNPGLAIKNGNMSLRIASGLKDKRRIAQAFNDLGIVYQKKGVFDTALKYYNKSLDLRRELGRKREIASSLSKIGLIHSERGNYGEALKCQLEALQLFEQSKDASAISITYCNLGQLLSNQKRYTESSAYYKKGYESASKTGNKYAIGLSLQGLAFNADAQKKYEESIKWNQEAISIFRSKGEKDAESRALNNVAASYKKMNKLDEALKYFSQALDIDMEMKNEKGICAHSLNIASIYTSMGKYALAGPLFEKGIKIAERNNLKPNLIEGYAEYARYYSLTNDFKKAYHFIQLEAAIRDSVQNDERTRSFAEMQTKYETEKKEKEIILLNQEKQIKDLALAEGNDQRRLLIIGIASILLISIAGFYLYRLQQQQKLNKALLNEQSLRLMAVIKTQEEERKRIAEELHDGIGQMLCVAKMNVSVLREEPEPENELWNSLENIIDDSVTEVRNVSHAMMPSVLMKVGLAAAVKEYLAQVNVTKQAAITLNAEQMKGRIPVFTEVSLYSGISKQCHQTWQGGKNRY